MQVHWTAIVKTTASSLLHTEKGIAETPVLIFPAEFWHWEWNDSDNLIDLSVQTLRARSLSPRIPEKTFFFSFTTITPATCAKLKYRTYLLCHAALRLNSFFNPLPFSLSCNVSFFCVNHWWIFQSGCCTEWINGELFFTVEPFGRVLFWNGSSTIWLSRSLIMYNGPCPLIKTFVLWVT